MTVTHLFVILQIGLYGKFVNSVSGRFPGQTAGTLDFVKCSAFPGGAEHLTLLSVPFPAGGATLDFVKCSVLQLSSLMRLENANSPVKLDSRVATLKSNET